MQDLATISAIAGALELTIPGLEAEELSGDRLREESPQAGGQTVTDASSQPSPYVSLIASIARKVEAMQDRGAAEFFEAEVLKAYAAVKTRDFRASDEESREETGST